ncbi:hypothetical protein SCBWM1_gp124 [Synechococcus phage S-CBWM1]|uniref:Uncharacterized protein n=1 Tax=Synechococcus phage S-CBWM1 TaxID=2053653 RepID=A0A3G1L3Q4_9CAUD|nr:hypothetical protein HOU61_gp073 [Synechococcus phage S-CBWM1]ATW62808.1 hypothetical protein SCBWM1_gp124 [Synechococcus phage S-CBWM1]
MKNSIIPSRGNLKPYLGKIVFCSGVISEFRAHPTRRDLDSVCLSNLVITPEEEDSVFIDHVWVLRRQLRRAKTPLSLGRRINFLAKVYRYRRLGGKSKEKGLWGEMDYGLSPREP